MSGVATTVKPVEDLMTLVVVTEGVWADNTLPRATAPANESTDSLARIVNLQ